MRLIILCLVPLFLSCQKGMETAKKSLIKDSEGLLVVDFEGLQNHLDNHPAETLVVNFWATWCKPCIQELPAFEKLGANYQEDGVSVILVSLDFPDQLDRLESFIEKKELQSEIIFLNDGNANDWIPKVDSGWSGAIPATLIRGKKNKEFYERSFTYEELEKEVRSHISK